MLVKIFHALSVNVILSFSLINRTYISKVVQFKGGQQGERKTIAYLECTKSKLNLQNSFPFCKDFVSFVRDINQLRNRQERIVELNGRYVDTGRKRGKYFSEVFQPV